MQESTSARPGLHETLQNALPPPSPAHGALPPHPAPPPLDPRSAQMLEELFAYAGELERGLGSRGG